MSQLATTFAALADPTRLAIIARLAEGEASVNDLAAPFAMSQPAVSRHIKVLEDCGLVLRRIDGTRRPCRLAPDALKPLGMWVDRLQRQLESDFSRLDTVLAAMQVEESNQDGRTET